MTSFQIFKTDASNPFSRKSAATKSKTTSAMAKDDAGRAIEYKARESKSLPEEKSGLQKLT